MVEFDKTLDFDETTKKNVSRWLEGDYSDEAKETIQRLLRENPQEITDSFYTNLEFGTAGLRGIMGVGTNRMNRYTVCAATQGLANYLKQQPGDSFSVFIGYDSRNNSRFFAEEAAKVLAGNGIHVYLTADIRPTPLVSFGCRHLKCNAAIMVTASHNPPEYNGYKVYWDEGGQILPPHDKGIIAEAKKIVDNSMIHAADSLDTPLIQEVGQEIDEAYYQAIAKQQLFPEENRKHGKELKVVYTSLHGTGITLIKKALEDWGFTNVSFVEKQIIPDGNFPTTPSPNPEEREALDLGIRQMLEEKADILIATDPDADRVGVAVRVGDEAVVLNGNQIGSLLMEHVCESLTRQNRMPENGAFIKTVVTTELMQAIADHYRKPLFNVLTGFKYIAQMIRKWEDSSDGHTYLFGGEESYGYLLGTQTRDKDAIIACCLIAETALHAKLRQKTLVDMLHDMYGTYGLFTEKLVSAKFAETKAGKEKMQASMKRLREETPEVISGIEVLKTEDYLKGVDELPPANILAFWLKDGSKLMVRPSGTEPKVKIYCGVIDKGNGSIEERHQRAEEHATTLLEAVKDILLNS